MINVTQTFLPPQEEYNQLVKRAWDKIWLTNRGELTLELEGKLKNYLGVENIIITNNGTIPIQIALKLLGNNGEIITTPFSYVATSAAIIWENCKPVFVDIDKDSLNIDAGKIEASITENTSAILATHVYGNPCEVERIDLIANKHNLKVIYDAAHAFGVEVNGRSIFEFGDISTCSLHATKLYHSIEGGLLITKDPELLKKLASIRNFGISGFDSFDELGLNGKNSEFHAAMGLANLKYIEEISKKRKALTERYDDNLENLKARRPIWNNYSENNGAYYPIIFDTEELMLQCKNYLEDNGIGTRRYFYPSLANALPYLEPQHFPITDDISKRVLCLPLFYDLTVEEVDLICRLLLRIQNN